MEMYCQTQQRTTENKEENVTLFSSNVIDFRYTCLKKKSFIQFYTAVGRSPLLSLKIKADE